jgi:predicted nucleotidyltransferase
MEEAFAASIVVALPEGTEVKVAPVAAQAILKIMAWRDRKHSHHGRDAGDLFLFLRHNLDLGNIDRAAVEHADLFEVEDFDHVEAGVKLLARDISALLESGGIDRLLSILRPEIDANGAQLLASQSGIELERARRWLEVLYAELARNGR